MKTTQGNTLDTGRRVQGFLDTQAAIIGTAISASLRAKLDAAVSQLAASQLEQDASTAAALGETTTQLMLRTNLFDTFVEPIGRAARIELRNVPEFPALVVLKATVERTEFVTKVSSQIEAAAKYPQTFLDHGLPTDFVAQVQAALAQVSASADARARSLSRRSAATEGNKTAAKAVRDAIGLLAGPLSPVLKKNPSLAADWIASKRIRQTPVTPLPTGSVVVPSTTPATEAPTSPATPPADASKPAA
jgi:hypothetical protein